MSELIYHRPFTEELTGKYAKVAKRIEPGSSVLEIGCHAGYFSRALLDGGHRVVGIEKDPFAAEIARKSGSVVIVGDVEEEDVLLSLNRRFDVILLMDVLEHLKEPGKLLTKLGKLLAKQGKIIVTGPNVAYWAVRKDLLLGRWNYQQAGILDRTHLRFFTLSTWRTLIRDAGYTIINFEPTEGMIPFEHIFHQFPPTRSVVSSVSEICLKTMPQIFAIGFIFIAVPKSLSNRCE